MKRIILIFTLLSIMVLNNVFAINGNQILIRMDKAVQTKSSSAKVIMKVYNGVGSYRTIKMKVYSIGANLSYNYYYYPRNIRGMKYLSRFDSIWVYYPRTNRVRKLPEHVQKRPISGVGGDFSARDMKTTEWKKKYRAKLIKQTDKYYILEAYGKASNTYKKLVVKLLKKNYYPVQIDYYNDDNRKFKTLFLKQIKKINGKWFAKYMVMKSYDRDAKTTMQFKNVKINTKVPKKYFSTSYLRR